jgi:membrane protease YdiL (CAAX protease family)
LGIFCAIAYTAIFMGLLIGMARIVAVFAMVAKPSQMFGDLIYLALKSAAAALLLNFGFRKVSSSWSEALSLKRFNGWLLLPMIVATAGLGILVAEAGNGLHWFFPPPAWLVKLFSSRHRAPPIEFLAALVVAPLTEEAIFRGLILRGLLRRYAAPRAILVSAVLFALWHRNPYQFVTAFSGGLLAGWLYVRTRSLWPCVIVHALINLKPTLVIMGAFPWKIAGYSARLPPGVVFQPLWLDALGAALAALGLIGLSWVFRRWPAQNIPQVNA